MFLKCSNCSYIEKDNTAKHCVQCGAALIQEGIDVKIGNDIPAKYLKCPNCSYIEKNNKAVHCKKCGMALCVEENNTNKNDSSEKPFTEIDNSLIKKFVFSVILLCLAIPIVIIVINGLYKNSVEPTTQNEFNYSEKSDISNDSSVSTDLNKNSDTSTYTTQENSRDSGLVLDTSSVINEPDGSDWNTMTYSEKEKLVQRYLNTLSSNGYSINKSISWFVVNLNGFYDDDTGTLSSTKVPEAISLIGTYSNAISK